MQNLADKNDELMIEVESLRAKIRHQETFENYNNQNIYAEEKLLSPKRKKATRQSFNKMTHSMAESTSDMDSGMFLLNKCRWVILNLITVMTYFDLLSTKLNFPFIIVDVVVNSDVVASCD